MEHRSLRLFGLDQGTWTMLPVQPGVQLMISLPQFLILSQITSVRRTMYSVQLLDLLGKLIIPYKNSDRIAGLWPPKQRHLQQE